MDYPLWDEKFYQFIGNILQGEEVSKQLIKNGLFNIDNFVTVLRDTKLNESRIHWFCYLKINDLLKKMAMVEPVVTFP